MKLLALLPQSVMEGKQYLEKLGVPVDDLRQVQLQSIGVTGTPTLLLVDSTGTVVDVWAGKLTGRGTKGVIGSKEERACLSPRLRRGEQLC